MGIFGSRDQEWEDIKEEYRSIKSDIVECKSQLQHHTTPYQDQITERFQYLIREDIEQDELSSLGFDGWDLVNFASYTTGFGLNGNSSMTVHLRYVFKRAITTMSADAEACMNRLNQLNLRKAELVSIIEARGFRAE